MTTASILGGLAGLLLGGLWVGGATFAAVSYFARKGDEDDVAKALKGVAASGLEALNFSAQVNEKYMVSDKLGGAMSDAIASAKKNPDSKEAVSAVAGFFDGVYITISSVDKDVGFKETFGSLATSASDLASQAVESVVDLNKQYKVSAVIKDKFDEVTASK